MKFSQNFFTNIHNTIQSDSKGFFYKIRVILNNLKKKFVKQTASEILKLETCWACKYDI